MINNKLAICLLFTTVLLTGCGDEFSGDNYKAVEARKVQNVATGTVISKRSVKIKRHDGLGAGAGLGGATGALAGGLLGNSITGNHTGSLVGAGIGALAGGVAGSAIQNRQVDGFEYTISLDNGNSVAITQGPTPAISVGDRVNIIYDNAGNGRVVRA